MRWRTPWHRNHHAGDSALAQFRTLRWKTIRRDWRDWGTLMVFIAVLAVAIPLTGGTVELVAAGLLGAMIMLAFFGWTIGGDAHSLPWMWGRVGEQQTEEALRGLGPEWHVEHDIPRERGNWDHVLVGPGGVVLLETKSYRSTAVATNDAVYLGRVPFKGGSFRFAAKELGDALQQHVERRPWVQPVVVIWGDFPQLRHEENGVAYLAGGELVGWLNEQRPVLANARCDEIIAVFSRIRKRDNSLGAVEHD
jgi:hypothetical protein